MEETAGAARIRLHLLGLNRNTRRAAGAVTPAAPLHSTNSTASASSTTTRSGWRGRYYCVFMRPESTHNVHFTDAYNGPKAPRSRHSLRLSLRLQSIERTSGNPRLTSSLSTKRSYTDCSGRKHSWKEPLLPCSQVTHTHLLLLNVCFYPSLKS